MAGQYPYWLQHTRDTVPQPAAVVIAGPAALAEWGRLGLGANAWRSFSGFYLVRTRPASSQHLALAPCLETDRTAASACRGALCADTGALSAQCR